MAFNYLFQGVKRVNPPKPHEYAKNSRRKWNSACTERSENNLLLPLFTPSSFRCLSLCAEARDHLRKCVAEIDQSETEIESEERERGLLLTRSIHLSPSEARGRGPERTDDSLSHRSAPDDGNARAHASIGPVEVD